MKYRTVVMTVSLTALGFFGNHAEAIRGSYGNRTPAAYILKLAPGMDDEVIPRAGWGGGMAIPPSFELQMNKAFMYVGPQPDFLKILQRQVAMEAEMGGIFPSYAYMAVPENWTAFKDASYSSLDARPWIEFVETNKDKLSSLELYRRGRDGRAVARTLWHEYYGILHRGPSRWEDPENRLALSRAAMRIAANVALYESDYYYRKEVKWLKKQLAEATKEHEADPTPEGQTLIDEMNQERLFYCDQQRYFAQRGESCLKQVDYMIMRDKCPGYTPSEILAAAVMLDDKKQADLAFWSMVQMQDSGGIRKALESPHPSIVEKASGYLAARGEASVPATDAAKEIKKAQAALAPFKPGLVAEYYDGYAFEKRKGSQVEANINAWWYGPFKNTPAAIEGSGAVSVVWQGKLVFPADGNYAFYLNSINKMGRPFKGPRANLSFDPTASGYYFCGSRLLIDGKEALDNWMARGSRYYTDHMPLKKGVHDFRLEIHSRDMGAWDAGARLYWSCADKFAQEIIPATAFYHDQAEKIQISADSREKAVDTGRRGR
ncbi:hypothetical protein ACFL1X_11640 [Candidatus Hydrogenedentota bacterium]